MPFPSLPFTNNNKGFPPPPLPDDPRISAGKRFLENLIYDLGSGQNPVSQFIHRLLPASSGFSAMIPEDRIYLRQFLNPDIDVLPKQSLRPASLSNSNDQAAWRHMDPSSIVKDDIHASIAGLGGATRSANFAHEDLHTLAKYAPNEDAPYKSVYDRWDFDSANVNPIVGWMLDRIGKPFHVYERQYVDIAK